MIAFDFIEVHDCTTSSAIQMADLNVFDSGGTNLGCGISTIASAPSATPSGEGIENLCDGDRNTKWLDGTLCNVIGKKKTQKLFLSFFNRM